MMKQITNILQVATIVASLMAATACVNNSNADLFDEPQQIGYDAVVGLSSSDSRAIISDLNYPQNMPFAAFAAQLGEGKDWATNKAEATTLIDGDAVAYNIYVPGKWTTQIPYYWPDLGSVSFFAYAPYNDAQGNPINNIAFTPTTGELKVTDWDVNDVKYKDVDLMIADPKYDLTSALAPSGVPTAFRHKLALVSFKAGLIQDYVVSGTTYHLYLQRVELRNVKTQGDYSSTSNAWSGQEEAETIVIYQNTGAKSDGYDITTNTANNVSEPMLVIPQVHLAAADGVTLYVETYDSRDGTTATSTHKLREKITDSHWAINNHYSYLMVWERGDPKYIEFTTPSIDGWVSGGSYTITIE